ncbi:LOW QUALITY PROTEIN: hypothetical protein RJ640_029038 [Escallonia rubra]|uniref:Uncharacterized protein n=1 Tax=Escallonia rubra TaxID=112253 RepID=A0AA88S3L0_9ASTE|nr:LOW QUALITY PROTEIN: hypothetical protein RJ640_029038 [Escallonia rubra]
MVLSGGFACGVGPSQRPTIDLNKPPAEGGGTRSLPAGIEVSRAGEGDAFPVLVERANQKFYFEFRTSTSCCSRCFTISIGNERRSGGTCGTTYWITPVRHEAADAESAPMPLAMPCLVPRHGGGSVARHEHRAKGRWPRYPHLRSDEWRTDRPGFSQALAGSGVPVKGASAYPGVIITTCTSHLGTVERVTRLLFHSTTFVPNAAARDRPYSQRGGWHYWQRPSGENAAGAKRGRPAPGEHSIGRKGSPDGGRARGGRDLRMNAGLGHSRKWREPHAGRPARTGDLVERPAGAHPTRGTEKLIEYKTYLQALPYSDRSEGDRGVTE